MAGVLLTPWEKVCHRNGSDAGSAADHASWVSRAPMRRISNQRKDCSRALIAQRSFPTSWKYETQRQYSDSGIMTFMINQNGVVYEKDLGKTTEEAAKAITEISPDKHGRR